MASHAISLKALIHRAIQATSLQAAPCTASTRLSIHNNALMLNQIIFQQRHHSQNATGSITAWISHQACSAHLVTVKLRQTIHCLSLWVLMLHLIPLFKDTIISKSIVSAQIDNLRVAATQLFTNFHGMAMRQGDKNYIAVSCNLLNFLHRMQILFNSTSQMRIYAGNSLASAAFRCNSGDFCLRMTIQKSQQLHTSIAGCADNTCSHIHPPLRMIIIQLSCIKLQDLCKIYL